MYEIYCQLCFRLVNLITDQSCYDGEVRLAYSSSYTQQYSSDTYIEITSGFLEVCYQGSWISVCLNSTNNTNTNQLAQLACGNIVGFGGMSIMSLFLRCMHMIQ